MAEDELLETWQIHQRIMDYILEAIEPTAIENRGDAPGRSVGEQFAHIHNVRLMWLKAAQPDLLAGLDEFETGTIPTKQSFRTALKASGTAIQSLISSAIESGRIKGFKPHPTAFVAYLVAHEFYHQGDIGTLLTASGHPLEKKVSFGMWEWGTR